ncbi:hypothetical protein, partial [Arsenicicoccus bolidensis]
MSANAPSRAIRSLMLTPPSRRRQHQRTNRPGWCICGHSRREYYAPCSHAFFASFIAVNSWLCVPIVQLRGSAFFALRWAAIFAVERTVTMPLLIATYVVQTPPFDTFLQVRALRCIIAAMNGTSLSVH